MPYLNTGVQYSGLWTRAQQMQAYSAGTWTGLPAIYSWGVNGFGQLGLGNTTNYSSPKQVGSTVVWTSVAVGGLSGSGVAGFGISDQGKLYSWGSNSNGLLGLNNSTNYSSPKQVGSLTNWKSVSVGNYVFVLSVKTDGTLWSWGNNTYGSLGLNNRTNYSSPKQIGALTNWSQVSAGYDYGLAIKTDGTLWAWGGNFFGQLGLGNLTYYSSPKQVGSLTNWSKVTAGNYFSLAIKTNGTLWSWGYNISGALGLGNKTYYSSPKQIGALTTWANICSAGNSSYAIKTDGTLWVWGTGSSGQLGLGNATSYSSPKQVGVLTNWSALPFNGSSSSASAGAIKTDGTLWVWGDNSNGNLGLGNTTSYSSPKQLGSQTSWKYLAMTINTTLAINSA